MRRKVRDTNRKQMGVADWFREFCCNLQVEDGGVISARYKGITRRLNSDFWSTSSDTAHSLYVGSYGRNTAINGFSDVDVLMCLPPSMYSQYNSRLGNGQSALLQTVKASIERSYSRTSLKADGQVICITFTDGYVFEVVPAFLNDDNTSYTFPNASNGGSWKTTNPRAEIGAIRSRNASCNNNLVRLCRMMRAWKNCWSVPIGGLLVDTLAYQFMEYYQHRDRSFLYFDYLCRDFFDWMAKQSSEQVYWRAPGSGAYVYGKGLFQYKARQCCNIAMTAIAHESASPSREWSAKQSWRRIFGTAFPN